MKDDLEKKGSRMKDDLERVGKDLERMRKELNSLKYRNKIYGLSNPLVIRKKKREIAKMLSSINKNKYANKK